MTTPNNPNQDPLTPNSLVEQLFNVALAQSTTKDGKEIARQVIDFLGSALFYAIHAAKHEPVVFLTETLVQVITVSSADDNARKEMLKHVGETILSAATQPPPGTAPTQPGAKP